MIVTVTMNPAIDKTVEIEKLERGGLNRIQRVEYDVGGKVHETGAMFWHYPIRGKRNFQKKIPQRFVWRHLPEQ